MQDSVYANFDEAKTGYEYDYESTDDDDYTLSEVLKRKHNPVATKKSPLSHTGDRDHVVSRESSPKANGHVVENQISSRRESREAESIARRASCGTGHTQVKGGRAGDREWIDTKEKTDYSLKQSYYSDDAAVDEDSQGHTPVPPLRFAPDAALPANDAVSTKVSSASHHLEERDVSSPTHVGSETEVNNNNDSNPNNNHCSAESQKQEDCHNNSSSSPASGVYTGHGVPPKYRMSHSSSGVSSCSGDTTDSDGERGSGAEGRMTPTEDRWGPTVPPKKRWLPRSMDYHGQVLVTDVTCHCVTVTFLESTTEKGFFKEYSQ